MRAGTRRIVDLACAAPADVRSDRRHAAALQFRFPVGLLACGPPARATAAIVWQTSSFQFEAGVANLGIGLAGLYAAFRGFEARLATNLVVAGFLGGAGIGHIRDIVQAGNFAPGNAGPILFTDLLTPLVIFGLLCWSKAVKN